ncbi:hypothetical protein ABAC460_19790 [Asticcacaulis sp. AC460]|nr:hypothetical protein ABAC460_19790 [Asticcacaulis sp. AC460]
MVPGGWVGVGVAAAFVLLLLMLVLQKPKKPVKPVISRFKDTLVNRDHRYCLGIDERTGGYFFAINVVNPYIEYDEYYAISEAEYSTFQADVAAAVEFAKSCGRHEQDHRLIEKPGKLRGSYVASTSKT